VRSLTPRLAILLVVTAILGACFLRGQDAPPARQSIGPDVPATVPPDPATTNALHVYFPRLLEDGTLGLHGVPRTIRTGGSVVAQLLEALVAGPNGEERADDHYPTLDRRTRLLRAEILDGLANVEFDDELRRVVGRPFSELAYWSIVFTATDAPGVERVTLIQSGAPLLSFGSPPVMLHPGASRAQAPEWVRPR
jgi:spore germination protein GerM